MPRPGGRSDGGEGPSPVSLKRTDFSFETVLSTARYLNLLQQAKVAGYQIAALFVLTRDPEINVSRVRARAAAGGHDVPERRSAVATNGRWQICRPLQKSQTCSVLWTTAEMHRSSFMRFRMPAGRYLKPALVQFGDSELCRLMLTTKQPLPHQGGGCFFCQNHFLQVRILSRQHHNLDAIRTKRETICSKHLVCVTGQNNNKYYDMREKPDGTFDATYGRIGATATTINYPMSKWDSTLNSKLRKGYEDMTELAVITEVKTQEKYKPIEDKSIAALIDYLRQQARETVRQNYTVGSEKVSQAMVNKAQTILNNLSTGTWTLRSFNDQLIELFTVIPRRMGNVRDHLAVKPEEFPEIISREQQLLDVMAGQVSDNTVVLKEVGDENKTVLEAFGLEFSPADADITVIKSSWAR
ncbi:MAG: hypothetical protein ACLSB9_33640 [Hydrogeniiclostridium mannosilyticum]